MSDFIKNVTPEQIGSNSPSSTGKASYLGTITNTASASTSPAIKSPVVKSRNMRFALQSAARELLPDHRVSWCLRRARKDKSSVDVMYSPGRHRSYYANLMTCSRIWECPVCSARVSEKRRQELLGVFKQRGVFLMMMTFTISHHAGESFEVVRDRLLDSYRFFTAGRYWSGEKKENRIRGTIKALEPVAGENGWHIHIHTMLICDSVQLPHKQGALLLRAKRKWSEAVKRHGGWANRENGVSLISGKLALSTYLTKMGGEVADLADQTWGLESEISKAISKRGRQGGRTMTQLLYDYAFKDDHEAGKLWIEAVRGLKGRKHLSPSPGLWAWLGREKWRSDKELADEQVTAGDKLLAALSLFDWRKVLNAGLRAELLTVAGGGSVEAVQTFLSELDIVPIEQVELSEVYQMRHVNLDELTVTKKGLVSGQMVSKSGFVVNFSSDDRGRKKWAK